MVRWALYLGLHVGMEKGLGLGGDVPAALVHMFLGSSGSVSTFVPPSPIPLWFTCLATTMAEYAYVKSAKLVPKGTFIHLGSFIHFSCYGS